MGYRGDDLDLRTPQTWSATQADLANASEAGLSKNGQRLASRSGPMWVDETVLAAANHAYDVALAHRSGEVRLEHFLHALTRIDAAADALETRGVRVAALRRESATIIASEIPVGLLNGKGAPRRSDDLAEILRLAYSNAARRNAPASIDDVLAVLFDQRADLPGLGLLARHTVRPVVRETVEQFPPLSRFAPEPRYSAPPVERYVRPISEPRYVAEAPRPVYRSEFSGTTTDTIQNTRIEALEQMVRALSNDLASERQVVSGMLKDLSRDTQAHREDQGRMHSGLYDRMQTLEEVLTQPRGSVSGDGLAEQLLNLEVGLDQRLKELGQGWGSMSSRLQDLDALVRQSGGDKSNPAQLINSIRQAVDLKPIASRLDVIEEALLSREPGSSSDNGVADRLKTLEGEIARALASNTASTGRMETLLSGFERQKSDFAAPIVDRVTAVAQAHQNTINDVANKLAERMNAVEQVMAAEIETAAAKHQAYAQDLGEVHDALMKLNQNQHTLAGSIDQWRTEAAGDTATISNRLANLDRDNERPIETLNALTAHMDTMNKAMIERYHRRNRFWYWLFGTDDWISKSWPSQTQAIEDERQRLRPPVLKA